VKKNESKNIKKILREKGAARELLQVAQLRAEKCELLESRKTYAQALELAKSEADLRSTMEALAGLLRLASEAIDTEAVGAIETELNSLMAQYPKQVPPMAWYCKGAIARHTDDWALSLKCFLRYLAQLRAEKNEDQESYVRGWLMMAVLLWQQNRLPRAQALAQALLKRFEDCHYRGVNGMLYQLFGGIYEKQGDFDEALVWFKKAHASFLGEHSWYYHLYCLYAYARVARKQRNFTQATWYLDLIEKAVEKPEFGVLRRELAGERKRLTEDSVDLVIDLRAGTVTTQDTGEISFGKQYVLLHILEALAAAHQRPGDDQDRGLSKADIIGIVWREAYRPESHDNKLYYNVNRLRKHIEQDVHRPKYLMNWKEGYRLAPGLNVHVIGARSAVLSQAVHVHSNGVADSPKQSMPGLRTARSVAREIEVGK
jgi:tetratricopeptide (TPR) repeat protein